MCQCTMCSSIGKGNANLTTICTATGAQVKLEKEGRSRGLHAPSLSSEPWGGELMYSVFVYMYMYALLVP